MNEPLSNFVKYKNSIDTISLDEFTSNVESQLTSVLNTIKNSNFNKEGQDLLSSRRDIILNDIVKFNKILDDLKNCAGEHITSQEQTYLAKSYQIYEDGNTQDSSEYILDRVLFHALIYREEIEKYLISRIKLHSKWQHAGMFIRPEYGKYVNEMTASDPLYIVDDDEALLRPTKSLWNPQYQSRVRYKIINESRSEIFKGIPKNQMNLVVAMNFFNHKPLDIIEHYMSEIYNLLKSGGTVIFTYNNCNMALAVQNFEKSLYSYTPESRVIPLMKMLGFSIVESYNEEATNVSWLEIRKPGKLTSLRGGQAVAKIVI